MIALFRKETPIILAVHQYADTFGTELSDSIIGCFDHKLNPDGDIEVTASSEKIAGLIGTLADMGHGDDFYWAMPD